MRLLSSRACRVCALAVLASLSGCGRRPVVTPDEAARHVSYLDRALEIGFRENGLRQWALFRGETPASTRVPGSLLAFFDEEWFANNRDGIADPVLRRKANLLYRHTLKAQFDSDGSIRERAFRVIEQLNGYRPVLDGAEVSPAEATGIVNNSPDRDRRRRAWQALAAAGGDASDADLRALVAKRNRIARALGFRDFHECWLDVMGLDAGAVKRLVRDLERVTAGPYRARYGPGEGASPLAPWDLEYVNHELRQRIDRLLPGDRLLGSVEATLRDMGFGETLGRITVHAADSRVSTPRFLTFVIAIPDDVRVIVTPGDGIDPLRFTFHEFGHALYYAEVRQESFTYRLPESEAYAEGLAKILERMPFRPAWFVRYAGASSEDARILTEYNRVDELAKIRRFLGHYDFERRLYQEPGENPLDLFRESALRFQGVQDPSGVGWSSDLHLVTQPLSSLSYVYARLIQAHVYRAAASGKAEASTGFGDFLRERLYKPGSSIDWLDLVKQTTGSPLTPDAYIEDNLALKPEPG